MLKVREAYSAKELVNSHVIAERNPEIDSVYPTISKEDLDRRN